MEAGASVSMVMRYFEATSERDIILAKDAEL